MCDPRYKRLESGGNEHKIGHWRLRYEIKQRWICNSIGLWRNDPLRIIVSCVIKCFLSIVGVHSRGSFKRICLFYLCHKVRVTDSSFQRMRTVQYLILRTYEKYGMFHNPKNKKKKCRVSDCKENRKRR